ncbi:MAG: hypothetical protein ABH885_07695, partial [Candidatus Omnitrophota bacterium]
MSNPEDRGRFQANLICDLIEKRTDYGKPINDIYLDDILLWEGKHDAIPDCKLEVMPYEIRVHIPDSNLCVRYFDSDPNNNRTMVPLTDWTKTETIVINPRINRQILRKTQVLPAGADENKPFGSRHLPFLMRERPESVPYASRNQFALLWFDANRRPVFEFHTAVLAKQEAAPGEFSESKILGVQNAVRHAYSLLTHDEKDALFAFQKNNRIERAPGEWVELPLPVSLDAEMKEGAVVTPREIIINPAVIRAPPHVLAVILMHGMRRSVNRFRPDLQPHEAAVFQETLKYISCHKHCYEKFIAWFGENPGIVLYGHDWSRPVGHAEELTEIDTIWCDSIALPAVDELYQSLISDRDDRRLMPVVCDFLSAQLPLCQVKPYTVYREVYRDRNGIPRTHIYIVYRLEEGISKVVRLAPRDTLDWMASGDCSTTRFVGNVRLDVVRDSQGVASDIIEERAIYREYPVILKWVETVNNVARFHGDSVIHKMMRIVKGQEQADDDLKKAAMDILFSLSKTHPDREMRVFLNRFIFDCVTERPFEFPQSAYNYSAAATERRFTFMLPFVGDCPEARVMWSVNGMDISIAEAVLQAVENGMAYFEWSAPVNAGWVHYAVQTSFGDKGRWGYIDFPESAVDLSELRVSGIIKFQDKSPGKRIISVRPEVFNMKLDGHGRPIVDARGNVAVGTLDDLKRQLMGIKEQGVDEIYLQVLETGAPGEAGPDSSSFSVLDPVRVSSRIGGMQGLLRLKEAADAIGIGISVDMIPHLSRSNRELSPRTAAWIFDPNSWRLTRRAASDGGFSEEWQDCFTRDWADPRNVRDYIAKISELAGLGFNFRVDVGHVFDVTFPSDPAAVGMERIQGHVVTEEKVWMEFEGTWREFSKTLDLRFTEEPNSVLAWIIYEAKKAGMRNGRNTRFYAENWHGHEARLIKSGVDMPFDPLIANAWDVVRENDPTDEFRGTVDWRSSILGRLGGGTVTVINNHDAQVPPVDAFRDRGFSAIAALIFAHGGAWFQHLHYAYPREDGRIDWHRALADFWRIPVNNYGPARVVEGQYWPGYEWAEKCGLVESALGRNKYLLGLDDFERRISGLVRDTDQPIAFDTGHDRVIGMARRNGPDEFLIMLSHQGSDYAADLNFHPTVLLDENTGLSGYGDDAVYEMVEVFNNEDSGVSPERPGDRIVLSGRAIKHLGLGPHNPLPILGTRIFRFRKIADRLPKPAEEEYDVLLKDSIMRYKRYGPGDRFRNSFVACELIKNINAGLSEFSLLFYKICAIVEENHTVELGDISRIFGDIVYYAPEIREKLHEYLVDIAVVSQLHIDHYAAPFFGKHEYARISAAASDNAIKILRAA